MGHVREHFARHRHRSLRLYVVRLRDGVVARRRRGSAGRRLPTDVGKARVDSGGSVDVETYVGTILCAPSPIRSPSAGRSAMAAWRRTGGIYSASRLGRSSVARTEGLPGIHPVLNGCGATPLRVRSSDSAIEPEIRTAVANRAQCVGMNFPP